MVIGLAAALAASVLFGVGAVVQAVAARRHGLVSWLMLGVALVYVVGWAMHLVSIVMLPLYLAQVGIAGSLAVTALAATRAVGEPLGRREWLAIAALVAGLVVLAVAAGDVGERRIDLAGAVWLYVVLVVVLLLGSLAARPPRTDEASVHRNGALLAILSGIAYAGSPVATRSVIDPRVDLLTAVTALAIGLYGLLGFWLYSLSLRRTSITGATASVVVLQTLLPAAVGVVGFGDTVRPGWWVPAALAFAVALAGALALSDAEARLDDLASVAPD